MVAVVLDRRTGGEATRFPGVDRRQIHPVKSAARTPQMGAARRRGDDRLQQVEDALQHHERTLDEIERELSREAGERPAAARAALEILRRRLRGSIQALAVLRDRIHRGEL